MVRERRNRRADQAGAAAQVKDVPSALRRFRMPSGNGDECSRHTIPQGLDQMRVEPGCMVVEKIRDVSFRRPLGILRRQ